MIPLDAADCPKFTVDHVAMPFTGVDIGQIFEMSAQVKLDAINPEGPSYVFEVLSVTFPEKEQGTIKARKDKRMKTQGITISING